MLADNASGASKIKIKSTLVIWSYTMKTKSEERVMKKCCKCKVVKSLDEFHKAKNKKYGRHSVCRECAKQYCQDNKEKLLERSKQYAKDNKEKIKQYQQDNKAEKNEYLKNRKANDPVFNLRCIVSRQVHHALTRNNSSKHGESVLQHLPYTIPELKEHIESQFEDWMTWSNRGEWHIDHIIPQSKLPYDSMDDPNFQKCWALENLQPLEAKENIRLGNREKM